MPLLTKTIASEIIVKDCDGLSPLHIAAKKGQVEVVKTILNACPESVKQLTNSGETCLHTAVVHNKGKTVHFMLKWLSQNSEYTNIINGKDRDGNTALHLVTSRKQLYTLKVFLNCDPMISKSVNVNTVNAGGFTPLDILHVLPHTGKIDMEIDKILATSGALRAIDLVNHNTRCGIVAVSTIECFKASQLTDRPKSAIINKFTNNFEYPRGILLVTAALVATITFHAAISFPSTISKDSYAYKYDFSQLNHADSVSTRSFLFFNSTGFITSIATIIFLLHEFPLKPWPQISVTTLFASYMCLINVISPGEALPLLSLAITFLLLAAAGKIFGFSRQTCHGGM